ncbi:FUSC family protein [Novosphingobium flavum]|uniref:FUSC family protein n=1 Tax=Novosphingobium flavum TaxID=1778672 RepID=UPI001625D99F
MSPSEFLKTEWRELTRINPSARPWQMPLVAALVTGLPLLAGAALGDMAHGVAAMLGTLIFLYVPDAALGRRIAVLCGCAVAMSACYAMGLVAGHLGLWGAPFLGLVAMALTMAARYARLNPPAGLFFIMAAAIGAYAGVPLAAIPLRVGLLALGTILALVAGVIYGLLVPESEAARVAPPPPPLTREVLLVDPAIIGLAVALSLLIAELLGVERPYWAPVSCLAVIQGASLRAIWTRQTQRVFGTAIGLAITAAIFTLPIGPWSVALAITGLTFVVEAAVVRHYGFAAMFFTPMSILVAEAPRLGALAPASVMQARLFDTIIGSAVGAAFGLFIHHTRLKRPVRKALGLNHEV